MTVDEVFAAWLRTARAEARVSQAEVAGRAGMYQQVIAKIECGQRRVRLAEAVAIAECLGATVDTALGVTADPAPELRAEVAQLRAVLRRIGAAAGDAARSPSSTAAPGAEELPVCVHGRDLYATPCADCVQAQAKPHPADPAAVPPGTWQVPTRRCRTCGLTTTHTIHTTTPEEDDR